MTVVFAVLVVCLLFAIHERLTKIHRALTVPPPAVPDNVETIGGRR